MRQKSKYRPRDRLIDPLGWVVERMRPASSVTDWLVDLKLRNHGALAALMTGAATEAHVRDVIAAHNMCTALVDRGVGSDYKWVVEASEAALRSLILRPRYVLTGPEITAMRDLLELHNQQIEVSTVAVVEDSIHHAKTMQRGIIKW